MSFRSLITCCISALILILGGCQRNSSGNQARASDSGEQWEDLSSTVAPGVIRLASGVCLDGRALDASSSARSPSSFEFDLQSSARAYSLPVHFTGWSEELTTGTAYVFASPERIPLLLSDPDPLLSEGQPQWSGDSHTLKWYSQPTGWRAVFSDDYLMQCREVGELVRCQVISDHHDSQAIFEIDSGRFDDLPEILPEISKVISDVRVECPNAESGELL